MAVWLWLAIGSLVALLALMVWVHIEEKGTDMSDEDF